uniref:Uncharacterized protein n=1 Tax=Haptolina brevifila TaxID=156173 RepID=A0A7S2FLE3_9EUKA
MLDGHVVCEVNGGGEANGMCVELARVGCEYDYVARRLGIRCGFPQLGEPSKRHVHTVNACLCRPTACLLALAAAAGDEGDPLQALPDAQRAMYVCGMAQARGCASGVDLS